MSSLLKIRNLSVDFPIFGGVFQRSIGAVNAVKNVSFNLNQGETLGIVGESGSGKSTLGKAILNVLKLTAPDVKINGDIYLESNNENVNILNLSRNDLHLLYICIHHLYCHYWDIQLI